MYRKGDACSIKILLLFVRLNHIRCGWFKAQSRQFKHQIKFKGFIPHWIEKTKLFLKSRSPRILGRSSEFQTQVLFLVSKIFSSGEENSDYFFFSLPALWLPWFLKSAIYLIFFLMHGIKRATNSNFYKDLQKWQEMQILPCHTGQNLSQCDR